MDISTGRPATLAPRGMVACPHSLASSAGVDALRAGGSAVDAALAAAAVLAVIYPHMTSAGGDAFWLIYDAKARRVRYLNGGGRAAACASIDYFRGRGMSEIPFRGILPATLTTPGAVASWCEAHSVAGKLPFARTLEAAIGYAREGFPVTARLANWIATAAPELRQYADWAKIFLPGGQAPRAGARLANPDLARTLQALAEGGRAGFYEGPVAREMARHAQENGGFFNAADLAAQKASWGEPLQGSYRDLTLYETPAPTQGFTVLQMLRLLEPFELHKMDFADPQRAHLMVQAKQIAYHDRDRWIGDPAFAERADVAAALGGLSGRAPAPDRPGARPALGQGPVLRQPDRRHGLRGGGRRRRQCGVADQQPVRRVRLRRGRREHGRGAAEPQRVFLARPGASERALRPARSPCTRSSPRSDSATAGRGACSAAWAPTASRRSTCRPTPR